MTETEWLNSTDPTPMFEFLRGKMSDRKLRLFACACCRRIWLLLTVERSRQEVEFAERVAEGQVSKQHHSQAWADAKAAQHGRPTAAIFAAALTIHPMSHAVQRVYAHTAAATGQALSERVEQVQLVKDIFGNPFRPVVVDPSWFTSDVVALARQMYETRDFSPMPILADALQDAGCENIEVLEHCRGNGPHVRGCYVVDRLLGKE